MEDEYSSDVNSFIGGHKQIIQQPIQLHSQLQTQQLQQQSQLPQSQMQEQIHYQQMQPQYYNQNFQPQYQTNSFIPKNEYLKSIDNFRVNFNTKENLLSVIVIVILFMLLSSNTFRKIISKLHFLNMVNSEYNITSLFTVGLVFAIIYTALKTFVF